MHNTSPEVRSEAENREERMRNIESLLGRVGLGMSEIKVLLERLPREAAERFYDRVAALQDKLVSLLRFRVPKRALLTLLMGLVAADGVGQNMYADADGGGGGSTRARVEATQDWAPQGRGPQAAPANLWEGVDFSQPNSAEEKGTWGQRVDAEAVQPANQVSRQATQDTSWQMTQENQSWDEPFTPQEFESMKAIPGVNAISPDFAGVQNYVGPDQAMVKVVRPDGDEFYVGLYGDPNTLATAKAMLRAYGRTYVPKQREEA